MPSVRTDEALRGYSALRAQLLQDILQVGLPRSTGQRLRLGWSRFPADLP